MRNRGPKALTGNYHNWANLAAYREDARRAREELRLIRTPGRSGAGVRLFSAIRNERDLLPLFLDHYRNLGVAGFIIVDNDLSDGSREFLLDQPDVELYHTASSYAGARWGTLWMDGLMQERVQHTWILYADCDELLVYDQCDSYPLDALIARLRALGERKLLAPLVDVYSQPAMPSDLLFDAVPEKSHMTGGGPHIVGGPRYRMAAAVNSQAPCLTKYPLVRYGPRSTFANTHFPEPAGENGHRILGRLLHLKLTPRFRGKVEEALREGQHWNDGSEYKGYARWLNGRNTGDLVMNDSRRYTGPFDLIDVGLLEPLEWHRSNIGLRMHRVLWPRRLRGSAPRFSRGG